MDYRKVIIAHRGFYEIEPRASYYDQYMERKILERWNQPELPLEEVDGLFDFIIHWDFHFKGDKKYFRDFYFDNFDKIKQLEKVSLYDLDIKQQPVLDVIREIFTGVANCGIDGRFESTDASKILQTVNPHLFVMWDNRIRKGILGSDAKYGSHYAYKFLPMMKRRLDNIIEFTVKELDCSPVEAITYIESSCEGKTIAKLIDEYNYVVFTMRTNFSAYLSRLGLNFNDFITKENIKVDLTLGRHSTNEYGRFVQLLDEIRAMNLIDAEERRRIDKEWRDSPEKHPLIMENLTFLKNSIK